MKECTDVTYDDKGRVYVFNDGARYHSVTTVLSNTADKTQLDLWRKRVGEKEAAHICNMATHLGEDYHLLGEYYLQRLDLPKVNPLSTQVFKTTIPLLAKHVTSVRSVEEALYSEEYRVAGRADAVLEWDGELCIFDFKLLKHHNPKYLNDYWIQTAIYAHCWQEMYGETPTKLVLMVGDKLTLRSKFFVRRVSSFKTAAYKRVFMFHN